MRPSNTLEQKWERIFSLRDSFLNIYSLAVDIDHDYALHQCDTIKDMLLEDVLNFCEWCMYRCTTPLVVWRLITEPSEATARQVLRPVPLQMGVVTSDRPRVTEDWMLEVREAVLFCIMREAVSLP